MEAENFSLGDYCKRVGFASEPRADLSTLQQLMRAQLFSVAFENLDVQAGKIVSLIPEDIVNKIVNHNRGGYCYEVNGLFSMALTELGIDHYFVGARPMFYPVRRPKTHMGIIAKIEGEDYLCDLGFGSFGIRAPLALSKLNQPIQQDDDVFRLACEDGKNYIMQAYVDGDWVNQYGFDLHPQEWIDFMPANYLNSTHPDTIFVQKLLVVKHNPQGRKILVDTQLKTVEKGITSIREVAREDINAVLAAEFGLSR
ncbi:MAG: arylamine N-acetyltransferase [Moraxellaceae bacterium]|nr:MAG: arylamine N-acetyltransferase [Moraxellaceae bacterium]